MKRKIPPLMLVLILTSVFVAAVGAILKYAVLKPLDLYQDESIIAVPFMLLSDETAKYMLQNAYQEEPETQPMVLETEPTAPAEVIETVPQTQPATEPIPLETAPTEPVVLDESWFDDALFIGDSRTQGLYLYAKLGEADYFCDVGLSVFCAQTMNCSVKKFGKIRLDRLLEKKEYGKIYINLGINEISGNRESLLKKYQELIDMIHGIQPDAVIILQGIMTVDRKKAASKDCYSLESIYGLNEDIEAMAVGDHMRYIDVNEWIADEEGYLPEDWSKDGCHPYGSGYVEWSQWLLENASTLGIS